MFQDLYGDEYYDYDDYYSYSIIAEYDYDYADIFVFSQLYAAVKTYYIPVLELMGFELTDDESFSFSGFAYAWCTLEADDGVTMEIEIYSSLPDVEDDGVYLIGVIFY